MQFDLLKANDWPSQWIERYKDSDWQTQLKVAYSQTGTNTQKASLFRITPYYASLINPNDPNCPIARQSLPNPLEKDPVLPPALQALSQTIYGRDTPWTSDAIGDVTRLAAPRLTHRYHNRAILHVASTCAMYCRFCFRKSHLTQKEDTLYGGTFDPALAYLAKNPQVKELILTGGDPLSLAQTGLEKLISQIKKIQSIEILRIHTRMPVTLPSRIDDSLCSLLSHTGQDLAVQLVTHFNHPSELTPQAKQALQKLRQAGVQLFNQTVLLRGVNTQTQTLVTLFNTLDTWGVRPYYLHHPDYTPETFGFRISIAEGRAIYRSLLGRVSGPALPHYILDLPGGKGKIPLIDGNIEIYKDGNIEVCNELTGTDPIQAAVYKIKPPHSRVPALPTLYLDLAYAPLDGAQGLTHAVLEQPNST